MQPQERPGALQRLNVLALPLNLRPHALDFRADIPKSWKVIQHVREKLTCRDCEKISQAPAPFHVITRGWAGRSLLAMVLFEKFGQHQPLN